MDIFDTIREVQDMQIAPARAHRLPIDAVEKRESAEDWYRARMAVAKKVGPFCYPYPETIGPDRAELLLAVNPHNRSLKKGLGEEMRRALINDQFRLNGETIIIAIDGLLNDGQNRLNAVFSTGIPIKTFVVWGVERDSRRTVDTGGIRLPGDFIAMEGAADGNHLAAIAKWLLMFDRGVYLDNRCNSKMPTKPEVTAFWIANQTAISESYSFVRRPNSKDLGGFTPLAVSLIAARRNGGNAHQTDCYFNLVCDGAGHGWDVGTPQVYVRNRLMAIRGQHRTAGEKIELILRGWKMFREGKKKVGSIPILGEFPKMD